MTLIPASTLSRSEMHMLGTNVVTAVDVDRGQSVPVNRPLRPRIRNRNLRRAIIRNLARSGAFSRAAS